MNIKRSANAIAMIRRHDKTETFHDRRQCRGGAKNIQSELLEELDDEREGDQVLHPEHPKVGILH